MNILVTGAAGFIGSHSAKALIARGDTIFCIDDLNDYCEVPRKEKNAKNLNIFRVNICDASSIEKIFAEVKPTILLHFSEKSGVHASMIDPELYHNVNVVGTNLLLEACKRHSVSRIIFASSYSVYNKQEGISLTETDKAENPLSPYAATKRAAENLCYAYTKMYALRITCLRLFMVYDPNDRRGITPSMIDPILIDNIVSGIISAVDNPFDFKIINLGYNPQLLLNKEG